MAQGWKISPDKPSDGVYAPWEIGAYTERDSAHFTALAPRALHVGNLMSELEKGRTRMERALPGIKPPSKLLVLVSRNSRETKALTKDVRTLAAVTALAEAQMAYRGPARQ